MFQKKLLAFIMEIGLPEVHFVCCDTYWDICYLAAFLCCTSSGYFFNEFL